MILDVRGVAKRFAGLTVLRDVSFAVAEREIVGLIGPNGAGKSTLFNAICGLVRIDAGSVVYDGHDLTGLAPHRICGLGLTKTSQTVRVFGGMTALENVTAGALLRHPNVRDAREAARAAIARVGLLGDPDRPCDALTVVERMRLELARTIATGPRVLLIDELMAGLNASEVDAMLAVVRGLRDEGMTLVVIEHNMGALMRLCDRIVALDLGEIVANGPPDAVARDPRVVQSYLGEKFAHAAGS
ncbi:MAG: ABC transporter ATP-binding protein [Candidatus Elarobacter sp.]